MGKNENAYYEAFAGMAGHARAAAEMLHDSLQQFDPETLPERMQEMHQIEHTADLLQHDTMERFARARRTPLRRRDVVDLSRALDDVTDSIEDVLMRAYMLNIRSVRDEARRFTTVILQSCEMLEVMVAALPGVRRPERLHSLIVGVNRLEEEGDTLFSEAMRRLFTVEKDQMEQFKWSQLFERLERCCDRCEVVADVVGDIVLRAQ